MNNSSRFKFFTIYTEAIDMVYNIDGIYKSSYYCNEFNRHWSYTFDNHYNNDRFEMLAEYITDKPTFYEL